MIVYSYFLILGLAHCGSQPFNYYLIEFTYSKATAVLQNKNINTGCCSKVHML